MRNITIDNITDAVIKSMDAEIPARNEFILISDIIGVDVLADMLDKKPTHNETISTVLGPFYRENPPVLPKGASIIQKMVPSPHRNGPP